MRILVRPQSCSYILEFSTISYCRTQGKTSQHGLTTPDTMADRRRINGPIGATTPPVYAQPSVRPTPKSADSIRKICKWRGISQGATKCCLTCADIYGSLEDWRHPLGFWIRISRTRKPPWPQQDKSEALLYCARSPSPSKISTLLTSHYPYNACQVCTFRNKNTTWLSQRFERAGFGRTSRDSFARGDHSGSLAEEWCGYHCHHHRRGPGSRCPA